MEIKETTKLFRWQNMSLLNLIGWTRTWEIKTRMVLSISSHYSYRHWCMCFTSVQNIDLACCACLSVSSSTPHTHTLSKNSFSQARGSFNDIWVCGSSAGFSAGCVYTALLINSLSLSRRKRSTFDCIHLEFTSESGSSGWVSAQWKLLGAEFICYHHRPEGWAM